jgi:DNA repair exonuclease
VKVVETAVYGSCTLPGHERERFIVNSTPSGYETFNRHYHKIEEKQSGYDFGLMPYSGRIRKDGSHKYIHIADNEIFNTEYHEDWVNNVRDYARNAQPAFIIHTGDICYAKGLKAHIKLMNTENMDCPVFYCIGNHDLVKGKYGEVLFESMYGPVYYSYDAGNVHYIVTPMPGGDHAPWLYRR